jgi:hypothetical protein
MIGLANAWIEGAQERAELGTTTKERQKVPPLTTRVAGQEAAVCVDVGQDFPPVRRDRPQYG